MGEVSAIEWTDSTFNPWIGCTKISPACDHCYAEALMDKRMGKVEWGGDRVRTGESNWKQPRKWQRQAKAFYAEHGRKRRVFCSSLADVFDKEVDPMWRRDLFTLIEETPDLIWLLLTKRIGNVMRMTDVERGNPLLPSNAAIGATFANQEEWDRDSGKLEHVVWARQPLFTFGSFEPLLGPIRFGDYKPDWVIVGGESGNEARPMNPEWVKSMRDQCAETGTPFLFKQWGEWGSAVPRPAGTAGKYAVARVDSRPSDMWPPHIAFYDQYPRQIDLFGGAHVLEKVGKKAAGRKLYGVTHDGFPEACNG